MNKRGRKRVNPRYFDTPEEEATLKYLNCMDDIERNSIYEEFLKNPLYKMTEAIINRYKLHSKELQIEELINDTLGFLHTKVERYDPEKGRAYSYFGTIIVRKLRNRQKKESQTIVRQESYEAVAAHLEENEKYSYTIDSEDNSVSEFFIEFVAILEELFVLNVKEKFLKKNEESVGVAILEVMKNWEQFFQNGGKKYEKNHILECLRNMTGLSTKEIRDNLKRFKLLYYQKKEERLKKIHDCDDSPLKTNGQNSNKKRI